jgi:hypothetical protein
MALYRWVGATVLEAVKGRTLWRAPQAGSSLDRFCSPWLLELVGTKGVPRFDRLSGKFRK